MITYEKARPHVKIFYDYNDLQRVITFEDFEEMYKKNIDTLETIMDIERIGRKTIKQIRVYALIITECPHCDHPNIFLVKDLNLDEVNHEDCKFCKKNIDVWFD